MTALACSLARCMQAWNWQLRHGGTGQSLPYRTYRPNLSLIAPSQCFLRVSSVPAKQGNHHLGVLILGDASRIQSINHAIFQRNKTPILTVAIIIMRYCFKLASSLLLNLPQPRLRTLDSDTLSLLSPISL